MKPIVFFGPVLLWINAVTTQTLPKEFQKSVSTTVETLYPAATLKALSDVPQTFGIIKNGQQIATLHLLTGEGPENKFTFMVVLDPEKTIKRVDILKYPSEFGREVTEQTWKKQFEGKKAGTIKNILELLRRIINFGVKKGLCPWIPPSQLHFEMPHLNNVKTEMLTAEERTRFIEAAHHAKNRKAGQLMLMAYYTGMRRSELFRLKWTHIDFEQGFINIVGEGQEGAKSHRDERIPLTQPVRELLSEIENEGSAYVFPGRDGISRMTDIHKQVNAIKKAARLPDDFRPLHGLRHTFASVAVSNGVPLSHVQKLLTHKDPSLTQRYAHLEDKALKNAAAQVGNFLAITDPDDKG